MGRLDYTRLGDTLLAGRMPVSERHIDALKAEGVTAVINLCEDREYWDGERATVAGACERAGITEHRLPVIDGATVPAAVLEEAVEVASEGVAYVHCRGGRERSETVCAAIVARAERVSATDAVSRTMAANPVFKPLPWQIKGLEQWAGDHPL